MLLRKAGYTGGVYREQYENKVHNIFPVVEFVLYWGKCRWRSGRDIRKLFPKWEIADDIWEYVDELKLHVFEMRYLPEETRKLFQSDMKIVVDFLAEGNGYRSNRKIVHKAALIKMIRVLSGEADTEDIEKWWKNRGSVRRMRLQCVNYLINTKEEVWRGELKRVWNWRKCLWMAAEVMICGEPLLTRITGKSYTWKLTAYLSHRQ